MRIVLLLLGACTSSALQTNSDLAQADLSRADFSGNDLSSTTDLSSRADLSGSGTVLCGAATCAPPANVCCRATPFGDGVCIQPGAACSSSGWTCDDPSDCPGQVCCDTGSGSGCLTEAQCTAMNGRRMCLSPTDCKQGEQCCGQGPSPNFYCGNVCPISRRVYKDNIEYLDEPSLRALHDQLLQYRLSTWRYRTDPAHQHLGFIIDDVGAGPAVAPDGEHVDLYGYVSMAVAALQVQAREIAALRAELRALKSRRK
jgi:hypothetical protein